MWVVIYLTKVQTDIYTDINTHVQTYTRRTYMWSVIYLWSVHTHIHTHIYTHLHTGLTYGASCTTDTHTYTHTGSTYGMSFISVWYIHLHMHTRTHTWDLCVRHHLRAASHYTISVVRRIRLDTICHDGSSQVIVANDWHRDPFDAPSHTTRLISHDCV